MSEKSIWRFELTAHILGSGKNRWDMEISFQTFFLRAEHHTDFTYFALFHTPMYGLKQNHLKKGP